MNVPTVKKLSQGVPKISHSQEWEVWTDAQPQKLYLIQLQTMFCSFDFALSRKALTSLLLPSVSGTWVN